VLASLDDIILKHSTIFKMKLYQSNFEDNTISASLGHIILYSFLFLIPDDGQVHPSTETMAILIISTLTVLKLYLIYFNKSRLYELGLGFALIILSALFWTYIYITEIILSSSLNHHIIIIYLMLTGIAYVGAFALYKNQPLNYIFSTTLLLVPSFFTPFYLEELKIPLIMILTLSYVINIAYSKMHNKNWKEFLAEKERNDKFSQEMIKTNFKLKSALKDAESATRMKSDFIATVSHEIRTPMNGVLGMSSLLQETNLNEEQKEFVDMIQSSADSLLAIIDDILDFSKLESGKLRIENTSFNLSEVVNEIAVMFGEITAGKGLDFNLVVVDELDTNVIGDPVRLRQILTNIIGNALKFTLKGYVKLTVKIKSLDKDIKLVQFKIEDTGIGIEKEKLKTIFDRFTQADASTTRKFGGTGLGLAITKELVELMNGHVDLKSKAGSGTIFYANIPFKSDSFKKIKINESVYDKNLASIQKLTEGKKILIVEDNLINQKVTLLMLQKTNCQIDTAYDGQEAVDMVNKKDYDLIFMDIQMPVLNGVEATAKIRALQKNNHYTPIIAMTANAMKGDREKYIDAGMDDYISKPIKKDILLRLLSEWLSKN